MTELVLVSCETKEVAEELRRLLLIKNLKRIHFRVFSQEEFFVNTVAPEPMILELIKSEVLEAIENLRLDVSSYPSKKSQREMRRFRREEDRRRIQYTGKIIYRARVR
jgi:hypothetical protein